MDAASARTNVSTSGTRVSLTFSNSALIARIALSSVCGDFATGRGAVDADAEGVSGPRVCPPINAIVAFSLSLYVDTVSRHKRERVRKQRKKREQGRTRSSVLFHHSTLVHQLERAHREVGVRREVGAEFSQWRVERWDWEMEDVATPFDVNHVVKGMAWTGVGMGTGCVFDKDGTNEGKGRTEKQHKAERD
jgi:hypothetical protein